MANNEVPVNNQDGTEIHLLPEMTTLSQGMMVAVDSEPTGTKSFNLSSALDSKANTSDLTTKADTSTVTALSNELANKVDTPAAAPVKGQVLRYNGTANEWYSLIDGMRFNSTVYPTQPINITFNTTCFGNPSDHDANSEVTSVQGVMTSADGQSSVMIEGLLLPFNLRSGYLHSWTDTRGTHLDWSSINEVPGSTSTDSGKALIVDSNGVPGWNTLIGIPASSSTDSGKALIVDSNGAPGWNTLNGVPVSTTTDSGKVLTVDASGIPDWIQPASGLPSIGGQDEGKVLTVSSGIASWVTSSSNVIDCGNKTEADIVGGKVTVGAANSVTKITLTTVGALTIVANTGVPNFAYEIDNTGNSNDVTITIKYSTESGTLLCPASGKKIAAGKHVQIRAFGNCWVLYDMYVDIYI